MSFARELHGLFIRVMRKVRLYIDDDRFRVAPDADFLEDSHG